MKYKKENFLIENVKVKNLVDKHETPLYCYSFKKIRENIENFKSNFKKVNPIICFSDEPISFPPLGIQTHEVLGPVFEHVACGVAAGVAVTRPSHRVTIGIRHHGVEVVGRQANGIGVGVACEHVDGGCSQLRPAHP